MSKSGVGQQTITASPHSKFLMGVYIWGLAAIVLNVVRLLKVH